MLIKLLNKSPIISVDEAKVMGQMMGVILKNNKLIGILSSIEYRDEHRLCKSAIDKYIQIPIDEAIIGPDAFLIRTSTDVKIHFSYGQVIEVVTCVYTSTGEFIGNVIALEVGHDYGLKSIQTEGGFIAAESIKKIGDVIIVQSKADIDNTEKRLENSEVFLDIVRDDKEEDVNHIMNSDRPISNDYLEEITYTTTENPTDYIELPQEEISHSMTETLQSKYKYLLGKRLVSSVDIADITYPEGSIIDEALIKLAINNNCILSIIMNAEE